MCLFQTLDGQEHYGRFCVLWLSVACVSFKRLMAKNTTADFCKTGFTAVAFAGATCECVLLLLLLPLSLLQPLLVLLLFCGFLLLFLRSSAAAPAVPAAVAVAAAVGVAVFFRSQLIFSPPPGGGEGNANARELLNPVRICIIRRAL